MGSTKEQVIALELAERAKTGMDNAKLQAKKKLEELKPSDIVKCYGFESLAEVSRKSKISAKTLAKWCRTDGHRRRV